MALRRRELLGRQRPSLVALVQGNERLDGAQPPRDEARAHALQPVPVRRRSARVGQRLARALLGKPQPGARLEQDRADQQAGSERVDAHALEHRFRRLQLVALRQCVGERRDAPAERVGRGDDELELVSGPCVVGGLSDPPGAVGGHRADPAGVRDGARPAERARRREHAVGVRQRSLEVVVPDQHEPEHDGADDRFALGGEGG